jgi:hypothetical protein
MNLHDEVLKTWDGNEPAIKKKLANWVIALQDHKKILEARSKFNQWEPLRVYLSTTKIRAGIFSVRFWGQEVGELVREGDKILLRIAKKTPQKNKRFGLDPDEWAYREKEAVSWEWCGQKARRFRKYFQEYERDKAKVYTEHFVESELIREMSRNTRMKFGGRLKYIQPVRVAGFPLQIPVPISACTGKPKYSPKGNIDILARRRGGRLGVWELKKPNVDLSTVLQQAYIYSVVLLKMLRQPGEGIKWYHFFVPNSRRCLPASFTVDSVVVVEKGKEDYLKRRYQELKHDLPARIGCDRIRFYAVHYDPRTLAIDGLNSLDRP